MAVFHPQGQEEAAAYTAPAGPATGHLKKANEFRKKLAKLFYKETWWMWTSPCICGGLGCVPPMAPPLCMAHDKYCCCESLCQSEPWGGDGMGFCFDICKCCCCVSHSACPPGGGKNDGVPLCALCNQRCGGESGEDVMDNEDAQLMKGTFFLYYCLCYGCGVGQFAEPLIKTHRKCCCIRTTSYTTDPFPSDRDCMYSHAKVFCCISACTCPALGGKRDGMPGCSCFGKVLFGPPAPEGEALRSL